MNERKMKKIRSPEDLPESLAEWSDEELGDGIKRAHIAGAPVLGLSYVRERHRRLGLYTPPEDKE